MTAVHGQATFGHAGMRVAGGAMMQPQEFSSSPYTESCLVIDVLGVQVQGLMKMV